MTLQSVTKDALIAANAWQAEASSYKSQMIHWRNEASKSQAVVEELKGIHRAILAGLLLGGIGIILVAIYL